MEIFLGMVFFIWDFVHIIGSTLSKLFKCLAFKKQFISIEQNESDDRWDGVLLHEADSRRLVDRSRGTLSSQTAGLPLPIWLLGYLGEGACSLVVQPSHHQPLPSTPSLFVSPSIPTSNKCHWCVLLVVILGELCTNHIHIPGPKLNCPSLTCNVQIEHHQYLVWLTFLCHECCWRALAIFWKKHKVWLWLAIDNLRVTLDSINKSCDAF